MLLVKSQDDKISNDIYRIKTCAAPDRVRLLKSGSVINNKAVFNEQDQVTYITSTSDVLNVVGTHEFDWLVHNKDTTYDNGDGIVINNDYTINLDNTVIRTSGNQAINGTISATEFHATSDATLKTNIVPLPGGA
eukprot:Pgem_evm1s19931